MPDVVAVGTVVLTGPVGGAVLVVPYLHKTQLLSKTTRAGLCQNACNRELGLRLRTEAIREQ